MYIDYLYIKYQVISYLNLIIGPHLSYCSKAVFLPLLLVLYNYYICHIWVICLLAYCSSTQLSLQPHYFIGPALCKVWRLLLAPVALAVLQLPYYLVADSLQYLRCVGVACVVLKVCNLLVKIQVQWQVVCFYLQVLDQHVLIHAYYNTKAL